MFTYELIAIFETNNLLRRPFEMDKLYLYSNEMN